MLLMMLDIDGTTRRISNEELSLDNSWFAELAKAPSVKYASKRIHGGLVAPTFGGFSCTNETFTGTVWPPTRSIKTTIKHTETTESEAETIIVGNSHLGDFDRYLIPFDLRKPEYDVSLKANITGTITDLFAIYCGPSYLNRQLDSSKARTLSPAVSYNVTSQKQVVDILSDITAFFCHGFYDDGATIYLYDCLADNGSMVIDEFDFRPATYTDGANFASFTCGDYSVDGSFSDGIDYSISPACHTAQGNVEAALADIKSIMERQGVRFQLPINAKTASIKPGTRLSWRDESMGKAIDAWIRVQSLNWDYDTSLVTIEGKGALA